MYFVAPNIRVLDAARPSMAKEALNERLYKNYDYRLLKKTLKEAIFGAANHIPRHYNLKGSICLDLGHSEAIYIITDPPYLRASGKDSKLPIKIGKHEKGFLIKGRIKELGPRAEWPQILAFISVPNCKLVEGALHNFFEEYKIGKEAIGTEWFKINPVEAIEAALWMSVLSCLKTYEVGELINLTALDHERGSSWTWNERHRRLTLVHECISKIDQEFSSQGTNFKIGDIEGRGFDACDRPEPLLSNHYPNFVAYPESYSKKIAKRVDASILGGIHSLLTPFYRTGWAFG